MENNVEKINSDDASEGKFSQEDFEAFIKEKNVSPEKIELIKNKFEEFLSIIKEDLLVKDLKIDEKEIVNIVKDLIYRHYLEKQ